MGLFAYINGALKWLEKFEPIEVNVADRRLWMSTPIAAVTCTRTLIQTIQLSEFSACRIANDIHGEHATTYPLSSRLNISEDANLRQDPHGEDHHP